MKVLFIDDEPDLLEQAKIFLEKEKSELEVETINSAEKALKMLEEEDYDVVVSDYQMPEIDGLSFLKILRKEKQNDVPFIMFTGKGREEVAMEALNQGADRYLQKGGDPRSQYGVLAIAIAQEGTHYRTKKEKNKIRKEWKVTVNSLPGIAALLTPDHEFIRINQAGAEVLGMKAEELKGKKCYEVVHDRDGPIDECPCEKAIETKSMATGEFKEKGRHWFATASPILDEDGEVEAFVYYVQDVTELMETRESLERSNRRFEAIYNDPNYFLGILDPEGVLISANQAALNFIGAKEEDVKGKKFWKTSWWTHSKELQERLKEAISKATTGEYVSFEATHEGKNKEIITVDFSLRPVRDKKEKVVSLVAGGKNITKRKKKEKELERSREEYKQLIDGMNDAVFVHNLEGNFLEVNDKAVERLGYSREEILSMGPAEIDAPKYGEKVKDKIQEIEVDENLVFESVHLTKDGKEIPVEISSSLIEYQGEPAILSVARDITDRKEREKELEELSERYNSLYERSLDGIYVHDFEGNFIDANPAALEILGYSKEEIQSLSFKDLLTEDQFPKAQKVLEELLETGTQKEISEFKLKRKDEKTIWVETKASLLYSDGKPYAIQGIARDITDRKEAEMKLRKSEKEKSVILNNISEMIAYHDKNHRIVWANKAYGKAIGKDPKDLVGQKCYEIWRGLSEPCQKCPIEKVLKTGETEEAEITSNDRKTWKTKGDPIKNEEGDIIGAVEHALDITKEKRNEEKIKSLSRFRESIIENANVWLDVFDKNGNVLVFNKAAEKISGYSKDEIIHQDKIWELLYPDKKYRNKILEDMDRIMDERGYLENYETMIKTKDGEKRTISWNIRNMEDEEGKTIGLITIGRDITEQKKIEDREEFLHSLLRHNLGNKIQIVQGYLELIEEFDLPKDVRQYLGKAKKSGQEGIEIIDKVRMLREIEKEKVGTMEIGSLVEDAIEKCRSRALENNIEIEMDCQKFDSKIKGGPLLDELFMNLINNSIQHSEGSRIRIMGRESKEEIICTIEDDGKGVPKNIKDKIFERGSKDSESTGSGLGLFLVKTIAESYGGSVEVKDSELGGAKFDVHLKKA